MLMEVMFVKWIKACKKGIAFFLTVLYIVLTSPFQFGSAFANAEKGGTLILLGNEDLPPIVYNDNGTAKGVVVDIAQAIGEKIGYNIKVLTVNWEKAQQMVLKGEADGLLHINHSPEREVIYDFSNSLLKSEFSIFVHKDNRSIKYIDDLRGRIVGVEAGGYPCLLLQNYEDIILEKIINWKAAFKALHSG
jgi:ABC-type amino acid transport substrate-binding protein